MTPKQYLIEAVKAAVAAAVAVLAAQWPGVEFDPTLKTIVAAIAVALWFRFAPRPAV